ncbi:MAG: hydrogenase iron-sulfur subunit [Desulfurivibrionaceae bacterium]|jgi:coenzyme F420-reducing hydrogenase delta subunit|nr:hydrogenase iron-sulfur subunit [Pseudomonadota bacterium]MCG2824393.1 hydrogenase iron-sulfur subunit [Desulfobulbaceae bacterium]MDP2003921.1 hydrogenase iron-sulfur subunit [Desulfurivibrionaceae bacterium]MDP2756074.1 hydrogenase iron-sulfur subunit [Desulfurivibrionaceae bacterium]PKN23470.1 MAG: hydrogenase iron-sulfur subunit [Deltaproteobacteria bacterium HGW-Deltaproteobacteria-3]
MSDSYQPKILGFLCNWCCYTAADSAGVGRYQYPPNLRVIRMMCTGRLDPSFPLEGLATGADAIFVGGCHPGECHYIDGNYHALVSASLVHEALDRLGVNRERFLIDWASAAEGPNFVKIITAFTKRVAALGPLGSSEGLDQAALRTRLAEAAEAVRGRKIRTGLINASREMMKGGDFSRKTVAGLVAEKCEKALNELFV